MGEVLEQVRYEHMIRIALNCIEMGKIHLEIIAECCELPLEKVQELAKQKGAQPVSSRLE